MKITTYNVNGIKARLPRLIEYLTEEQPDVVCLQELKSSDETFPEAEIRDAGYGAVWHGQKGFNGVAVLAKGTDPVERARGLSGDALGPVPLLHKLLVPEIAVDFALGIGAAARVAIVMPNPADIVGRFDAEHAKA